MKIIAPAKINLMLQFTGRRADGYHLMQSAVAFADIGDVLEIEPSAQYSLHVTGPFADHAPASEDNLVTRAIRLLEKTTGHMANIAVTLTKNIPAGAGLGGGSADAAALLKHLKQGRADLAVQLGADVPVSLKDTPQWVEGIGDDLSDVSMPPLHAVLIWPGRGLSTSAMYAAYRDGTTSFHAAITKPDHIDLFFLQMNGNDFTDLAIAQLPVLRDILNDLQSQPACHMARLSGSGSACFGLYATREDAKKAADNLSAAYPDAWVKPCVLS